MLENILSDCNMWSSTFRYTRIVYWILNIFNNYISVTKSTTVLNLSLIPSVIVWFMECIKALLHQLAVRESSPKTCVWSLLSCCTCLLLHCPRPPADTPLTGRSRSAETPCLPSSSDNLSSLTSAKNTCCVCVCVCVRACVCVLACLLDVHFHDCPCVCSLFNAISIWLF